MTPQLDKALRHGGMSRRGFLRAMGFTTAAVLVPGLVVPQTMQVEWFHAVVNGDGTCCKVVVRYIDGRTSKKILTLKDMRALTVVSRAGSITRWS